MSINSSSAHDNLLVLSSSNSSIDVSYSACQDSAGAMIIYTIYFIINIFFLPLYILILYMGFKRWRSTPAGTATSHSNFFTYQMMMVEIVGVFALLFYTLGTYIKNNTIILLGVFFLSFYFPVQTLFHVLTCIERYLAVVHPITYMHLREAVRVRIRNISTIFVWLVGSGWLGLTKLFYPNFPTYPFLSLIAICVFVTFFCCVFVLFVLDRSGPGQMGGNKGRVDQSKQRAFHMIMAISATLLLRFVGLLVAYGIDNLTVIDLEVSCVLLKSAIGLTVPSSLVLPLLYLLRAGKLSCFRKSTKS